MSTGKITLARAELIAAEIVALLQPGCERILIAGSIRRQKDPVGDIEIVAIPKMESAGVDLFGESLGQVSAIDGILADIDRLAFNTENPANGPKYKRLIHVDTGIKVDLFLANKDNWGNILAIRTGPFEFGKWCMTARPHGAMPTDMQQRDGYLWRTSPGWPNSAIYCPEEEDFFTAIGLPTLPPNERTESAITRLRKELK